MAESLLDLPFVTRRADGTFDMWVPQRPPSYGEGNQLGREYAAALITFMTDTDNPTMFGRVIQAISRKAEWSGVEVGFCHAFGVELIGLRVAA